MVVNQSVISRPAGKGVEGLARVGSRAALSFAFAFLRRAWRSGEDADLCSELLQESLDALRALPEASLFDESTVSSVWLEVVERATRFLRSVVTGSGQRPPEQPEADGGDPGQQRGVLSTVQSAAQSVLQSGWSVLLPTAEERARALSALLPCAGNDVNISPGRRFMIDLLVGSLMADGGLESALHAAITAEIQGVSAGFLLWVLCSHEGSARFPHLLLAQTVSMCRETGLLGLQLCCLSCSCVG
ncbi:PREDICTED: E3 ubiquitin-protein ligase HERC2-like [Mandrillus leucophaeus]|uniref:E3 ubiquitin-protein ligase HERC2-like n=1 Tax=Mandrillus leucophaeus TaxID=9568 RepID=UPI0005F37459|nr:PREDICTED: E3 ubiquitin-protein ligase HERC2-like [Mandrillus leucophaeus]